MWVINYIQWRYARKVEIKMHELEMVQERYDYWLEEGGDPDELRDLIIDKMRDLVRDLEFNIECELSQEEYISNLEMNRKALTQLKEWEAKQQAEEEGPSAGWLMKDYGLYCGHELVDGATPTTPIGYLETFMEMAWQPPKKVCREFLLQFHLDDSVVDAWMDKIAWDEDEEDEL